MNFLSSAISSLTGSSIPYTFKDKIEGAGGDVWTVYEGVNPKTTEPVLIFELQKREAGPQKEALARNAFKKLKMIKFPQVVAVLDFIENDLALYMVTEPVVPLDTYLEQHSENLGVDARVFGTYSIAQAVAFINSKCNCIHAAIGNDSVYVTALGDWKLFGFELCTNLSLDPDQPLARLSGSLGHRFQLVVPPNFDLDQGRQFPKQLDLYELGQFMTKTLKTMPRPLAQPVRKLVVAAPQLRSSVDEFLASTANYFESNDIVTFNRELDELKFKTGDEKLAFCKYNLSFLEGEGGEVPKFPPGVLENKLLPELVAQYGTLTRYKLNSTPEELASRQETSNLLLNHILNLGRTLESPAFDRQVKPILFEAYGVNDRQVRMTLLQYLGDYRKFLSPSEIQLKVFTPLLLGFADTNFLIRETTLKLLSLIIDEISQKQINNELLRVLAKLQMDPKPLIRVNTLVLIIKILPQIYTNSKNNVLITALSKLLRDTFIPSKMTALTGFANLKADFTLEEMCSKVLGQLAILLMDPTSAKVRREAKRVFDLYLQEVEKHAETLPDKETDENQEEADFFARIMPQAAPNATAETGGAILFGWNMMSKLVLSSTVNGSMNQDLNTLTPDLTRTATPTARVPLSLLSLGINHVATPTDGWGDDDDDDDGWGNDDEVEAVTAPVKTLLFGTTAARAPAAAAKPRTVVRPAANTSRTGSSLKLGEKKKVPGSTLKLDLAQPADDDDDGWGNDDDLDDW